MTAEIEENVHNVKEWMGNLDPEDVSFIDMSITDHFIEMEESYFTQRERTGRRTVTITIQMRDPNGAQPKKENGNDTQQSHRHADD